VPAWIAHNGRILHPTKKKQPPTDGWADETFLIKYRLLSANEENGNYIVTAFMSFSAPTGNDGNSNHHGIFTPTIAAGKGFGNAARHPVVARVGQIARKDLRVCTR
jgi:hypothetical protein